MASTVSVSKGCFVFNKNKFIKKKTSKKAVKQEELLCDDPWYLTYKESWNWAEEKFETLRHEIFESVLMDLVSFVGNSYRNENVEREISTVPTAALLTGINMPDHGALFTNLCNSLHEHVSPHVATLHAQKCKTIRHTIEQMTSQFMNAPSDEDTDSDESDDEKPVKVKKAQCNMLVLQSWYKQLYKTDILTCSGKDNKKRNEVEIKPEHCIELLSPAKKLKLEKIIQDGDKIVRGSPQRSYLRENLESEDESEEILPRRKKCNFEDSGKITLSSSSKSCSNVASLNDDVNQLYKTPKKAEIITDKEENSSRLRRTPRSLLTEGIPVLNSPKRSSPRQLYNVKEECIQNSQCKPNGLIDKFSESTNIQRTPSKDTRIEELQKSGLRRSSRTPKTVTRLVEELNVDSDSSVYSPSKHRKNMHKDEDYFGSQRTPVKNSVLKESQGKNQYVTPVKNKRHNLADSKPSQLLRSPKIVLRAIDGTYEVKNIESGESLRTSSNVAKVIDELYDEKSPSKEKWVCEVALTDLATDKRIPKIILRQLHELKNLVSPPKSLNKVIKSSEITSQLKARHSPLKLHQTPIKNTKMNEPKEDLKHININNHHSSMKQQYEWSGNRSEQRKKLVIIIPEFEKFSSKVLQDFILILRSCIPALPIVLIMGIATSVAAVHHSLPYRMSACLSIKAFQSPPSVQLLNLVLEQILFFPEFPFRLGNKTFCFLMDAFLYYDLSVKGFVQAIKVNNIFILRGVHFSESCFDHFLVLYFCMMEHFCGQNWKQLCCSSNLLNKKQKLHSKEIATLRKLPSFLHFLNSLEDEEERQKLMNDDGYMHKIVLKLMNQLYQKVHLFHIGLKCLNILVADLPKRPLGTHVRELYGMAASSPIMKTSEYRECLQLLGFLSRDELVMKIDKIITFLHENKKESLVKSFAETLSEYRKKIQEAGVVALSPQTSPKKILIMEGKMNRYVFKEKLMQLSKRDQHQSPFEKMREEFLTYLSLKVFPEMLKPLGSIPLIEVIMFDNTASVRTHIVGAPRAAIHTALNDPQFYLECECCVQTEKDSILMSMPDICIAYKLYRECGRLINLFDWLQVFSAIIDPQDDEELHEVKPQVQARFTRAVAELQFMGFLKTSSRKVDHVTKLFFDGGF